MTLPFSIPFKIVRPILHALDAEIAHSLTLKALKCGLSPKYETVIDPRLNVTLWDRKFPNPVGLAAGFDKNAEVIAPMLGAGFGFVEVGGVTVKPQAGLPKPRIFRDIKNESIINRMDFPNVGIRTFKENVTKFLATKPRPNGMLGIQIVASSKQKEPLKDYLTLIKQVTSLADYVVFNVSCPNTPGLRDLQRKEFFDDLATEIIKTRDKVCGSVKTPIIVKLSPDLDQEQVENLAAACLEIGIDGVTLSNTTKERPEYLDATFRKREGGLSGKPLRDRSTEIIKEFYKLTKGQIPIIGVGGISNAEQAYEKIKAGASLVQLYSALVYHGPEVVADINNGLLQLIERDGFKSITEATGTA